MSMTFVEAVLAGSARQEEIDAWIDAWHDGPGAESVEEHLGMTLDEYALWVEEPDALPFIIEGHRTGRPVLDTLIEAAALAPAIGDAPRVASRIIDRLRAVGRI